MKNNSVVTELGQHSSSVRAVAYFRSSSQADHGHAISIQQDQARQWAKERGIEIIHEFCDIDPSGPDAQKHLALTEMLNEWVKPRSDFELVLCFDASRLGRFSGSDRLATPVEMILQNNKQLIFTSMGKPQTR